jgi:hypothetical protein
MKFFPSTSAATRRIALSAVFASLSIAGCGGGGGSDNSIKPTKAMYDQIKLGMTYAQVVNVVGGDSQPVNLGWGTGANSNKRNWNGGTSTDYSSLLLCFPNNAVAFKFYRGPETGGNSSPAASEGDSSKCID